MERNTLGTDIVADDEPVEVLDADSVTDEVDDIASTVVIPEMERRAEEARAAADKDWIQDIQDEYNDARRKRAEKILERRRAANE